MLTLLNCINIKAYFDYKFDGFDISFLCAPIQLSSFESTQRQSFESNSAIFNIDLDRFEIIKLIKTDTSDCLFIPFEAIWSFEYSGLKSISSTHDFNKLFAGLNTEQLTEANGFIIPLKYRHKIFFKFDDKIAKLFGSSQKVIHQILKARYINWRIQNLGWLLEINKLLSDHFSRIKFKYSYLNPNSDEDESLFEIVDSPDCIDSKFIELRSCDILPPDELNLVWKLLRSSRTRFNIILVLLKFRLLSECLAVLSLCANCLELELVELWYKEVDVENEQEIIENAKIEFVKKLGSFICLKIMKWC